MEAGKRKKTESPGGPGVRPSCFHSQGLGFHPWLGNYNAASHKPLGAVKERKIKNGRERRGGKGGGGQEGKEGRRGGKGRGRGKEEGRGGGGRWGEMGGDGNVRG